MELEAQVKELKTEQARASSRVVTNIIINTSADGSSNVQAVTYAALTEMVHAALESKIGSPEQVEAIFQSTVEQEMAAYESRVEAEKQAEIERKLAEAEQKRKETEQKRKEHEEQRELERQEQEQRRFETYAAVLNVNGEQYQQIKVIEDQTRQTMWDTMRKMRSDGGYTPKNYQEVITYIKTQQTEALKEILDANQLNAYNENYGQASSFGHGFGGGRGGPGGR